MDTHNRPVRRTVAYAVIDAISVVFTLGICASFGLSRGESIVVAAIALAWGLAYDIAVLIPDWRAGRRQRRLSDDQRGDSGGPGR